MKHLSSTSENWTVKYRPKSISEMIIPESCKRYFERYQGGQRQPLILFGKPGSGKSLMASLLSNEDNIHIQCGLESDIKKIQEMLKSATSNTLFGSRRTIIIDDCENLPKKAQSALREIDRLYDINDFIFSTNHLSSIDPALKSRLTQVSFDFELDEYIKDQARNHIKDIFLNEAVRPPDDSVLNYLIKKHYPDLRQLISEVQKMILMR